MSPRFSSGALIGGMFSVSVAVTHAALISHDSFSGYTAGQLPANPAPAVTGYTGDWVGVNHGTLRPAVTAGDLTYSNPTYLGSSGNQKVSVPNNTTGGETDAGNSGRAYRLLDSSLTVTASTEGTFYMSFLFQSGQESGATIYQALHLNQGTNGDANRAFDIGLTTNGGFNGLQYNFGVNGAYTGTGVASNTTVHLFVVRFDLSAAANSDSVTVWVDPSLGDGDPTGGTTVSGTNFVWDTLMLSDYDSNSAAWDEIRWGTTFDSVTAIPEPAAALLGSMGLLALLRRRRK